MTEYTQTQAYKHLLEVSQNIIYSSDIDQDILKKYQQLKNSILKKIPPNQHQPQNTYYSTLLSSYRLLLDNTIKTLQSFEEQLENHMERNNFNQLVISLNQQFQHKLSELQPQIDSQNTKTRLLHKQQLNTLKDQFDQLDSKFENLGLLIEVHKKMHQIILQATKAQQKKSTHQSNLKQKIQILQTQISHIADVKAFIQHHKVTEENYAQFKIASKTLKKTLFTQFK